MCPLINNNKNTPHILRPLPASPYRFHLILNLRPSYLFEDSGGGVVFGPPDVNFDVDKFVLARHVGTPVYAELIGDQLTTWPAVSEIGKKKKPKSLLALS